MTPTVNPTSGIDLDFSAFTAQREESSRRHFDGVSTDYCFSLDLKMRQRLAAIPALQLAAKAFLSFGLAMKKQILSMQGVAVGPNQFPRIYTIAQDCAERLGIGIPQVFVLYQVQMNAYTLATEESGDMLVLHSSLVEAMTDEELRFVIGHECGHIHNSHSVWNSLGQILSNTALNELAKNVPGAGLLLQLLGSGVSLFLASWFRCAELTADRAGLICCGNLDTARYALAKLATGGRSEILKDINLDEYVKQLESNQATPMRLWESVQDHPIVSKRIAMTRIFRDCEVLYRWRPEMRGDKPGMSKDAVDFQCEQIARVFLRKGGN
jgi:Zn-dependent protease with chaperone function